MDKSEKAIFIVLGGSAVFSMIILTVLLSWPVVRENIPYNYLMLMVVFPGIGIPAFTHHRIDQNNYTWKCRCYAYGYQKTNPTYFESKISPPKQLGILSRAVWKLEGGYYTSDTRDRLIKEGEGFDPDRNWIYPRLLERGEKGFNEYNPYTGERRTVKENK